MFSIFPFFTVHFLQELIEHITTRLNFESEGDTAELTRADIIRFMQSEKIKLRGVNLRGLDLSKLVRYSLILSLFNFVIHVFQISIFFLKILSFLLNLKTDYI